MKNKVKLIRITTIARSMNRLLEGQLSFMSKHFDVKGIASPDMGSDILRKRENVDLIDLKMNRGISPFHDIVAIIKMFFIFRKEKPTIIHSHTPKAGLVAMIAGKFSGVPIRLHTIAGLPLETTRGVKRRVLLSVEKIIYSFATKIYPNSYGVKDFILNNKLVNKSKVGFIANGSSNGIDLNYFKNNNKIEQEGNKFREEFGILSTDKVFLFVGRLVVDKGIEPLIDAWCLLQKEEENIKLILVGDFEEQLSPLPPHIVDMISKNKTIVATGYQMDVRPFFGFADFFVFPSYREGLPNVVLQAGAFELPMIVTNINGSTDIVEQEVNGVIIPVKDTAAIYKAMKRFLVDSDLVNKLRQNARKTIEERYDRNLIHESLLKEYKHLLNN